MLTPDNINEYASAHSSPELSVLHALSMETEAQVPGAHMLTGHLAGSFLQLISKLHKPEVIVELGTYTGYSAICLAQGLAPGGVLHTFDIDDRWQALRDKYWQEAGISDCIVQHIGDAATLLPTLDIVPDLVFIDADKKSYFHYLEICLSKMNSGGLILVDNVLFKGEVLLPPDDMKKAAKHIHDFNDKILMLENVDILLLPVRDGITIIRKK